MTDLVAQVLAEEKDKQKQQQPEEMDLVSQVLAELQQPDPNASEVDKALMAGAEVQPDSAGFLTNVGAGVLDRPESQMDLYAKAVFPDMPIEESREKFGYVDGNIVYVDEDGGLRRVDKGFKAGLGQFVGQAGPSMAGGIAGGIAGTPLLGGALGAAAGEGVRQMIGEALGEEETTADFAKKVATEGAVDLAFGKLFDFFGKQFSSRVLRSTDKLDVTALKAEQDRIFKETGIRLDLAQLTNSAQLRSLKLYIAKSPGEAQDLLKTFDDLQAGQVEDAIGNVIRLVSRSDSAEAAGLKGVSAANAAITLAEEARRKATRPLYEAAFQSGDFVVVKPVVDLLDAEIAASKGGVKQTLMAARKLFLDNAGNLDESVEGLHATKVAIDALIDGAKGDRSVDRITLGKLVSVNRALTETMEEWSGAYRTAQQAYREHTRQFVNPLKDSVVGVIAKTKDIKAATVAAKLFEGNLVADPVAIRRAKMAFKQAERLDPMFEGAWDDLVGQYLRVATDRALKDTATGTSATIANQFKRSIAGTAGKKAALREALGGGAEGASRLRLWDMTLNAIDKVGKTPLSASDTNMFGQIQDSLMTGLQKKGLFIVSPIKSLQNVISDASQERALRMSLDALMDPNKAEALRLLRTMQPSKARALAISGVITGSLAIDSVENFFQ
jgi:hypothetical protein